MKGMSVLAAVAVVLMMYARGEATSRVSRAVSCVPDCTGIADGEAVVDPWNCREFYYCIGGEPVDVPTPCEAGEYFDSSTGGCLAGSCVSICVPTCSYTCTDYVEVIADPYDCTVYYFCSASGPFGPNHCPTETPYFNGTACVSEEICCTGYCDPYCDGSGFALMPDPTNCEYFYICNSGEGVPGSDVHYRCGDGEYFDSMAGECVTGPAPSPCPTLCDAAGGSTV